MKTKNEKIQDIQTEMEKLKQQLEELKNEKENKRWRAESGGIYFVILTDGCVWSEIEDESENDVFRYNTRNYFKTREEAKVALKRKQDKFKILDRIEELNGEWEADFNNSNYNFSFSLYDKEFRISSWCSLQWQPKEYYFKSREIGEQLIQEFGEETIINALFKL